MIKFICGRRVPNWYLTFLLAKPFVTNGSAISQCSALVFCRNNKQQCIYTLRISVVWLLVNCTELTRSNQNACLTIFFSRTLHTDLLEEEGTLQFDCSRQNEVDFHS